MPGFDGTGPRGLGPFTGKGMGYCAIELDYENNKIKKNEGRGVFDMPRGDGTGPMGLGPMTGGGRGYCAVNLSGKGVSPGAGRRFFGRGGGRGYRNCFYATGLPGWMRAQESMPFGFTKDEELAMLKNQAAYLKDELNAIETRARALEGK